MGSSLANAWETKTQKFTLFFILPLYYTYIHTAQWGYYYSGRNTGVFQYRGLPVLSFSIPPVLPGIAGIVVNNKYVLDCKCTY